MKCALIVGHKATSQGACNQNSGLTEFVFNNDLVDQIIESL